MTVERGDPPRKAPTFLVATDYSQASARALDYAVALAGPTTRLVVLHAHPLPLPDFPEPAYVPDWMPAGRSVRGAEAERLHTFSAPARAAGLKVETVLEEGLPADVILGRAAALQPELIVLGTGKRGRAGDWIMGSTAERVIRRAAVPVLTATSDAPRPTRGIKSILCALDFAGTGTLNAAHEVARRTGGALTVLHVVEPALLEAAHPRDPRQAERRLAAAVACIPCEPSPRALIRVGDAGREIVEAAREAAVDLVVVGLRDHGRWPAELPHIGSTAGRVLRHASCAVLTVPSTMAPQPLRRDQTADAFVAG